MSKPISHMYANALHAIATAGHDIAAAIREHAAAAPPTGRASGGVSRPAGTPFAGERGRGGYVIPPGRNELREEILGLGSSLARSMGAKPAPAGPLPGTAGRASVRGVGDGVRVMRVDHSARGEVGWVAATEFPSDRFGVVFEDHEVTDFVPDGSTTTVKVTKVTTREDFADALARHYGDHESLAAVGNPIIRQNYLDDADALLAMLGGAR